MLTAFRTGTRRPVRGRPSPLGRPLERLEDRTTPAAGGILFGSPAGQAVTNLGGPVIANAHVVEIFWGSGWTPAAKTAVQTAVGSIVAGPYLSAAAQYNAAIGPASVVNAYSITSTNPPAHFTGADVTSFLAANLKDFNPQGTVTESAMTDPNVFYFVFPQPGSTDPVENLGGLHTYLSNGVANYHTGWTENVGGSMQQMLDDLTTIFSHELVEAVTDPEGSGIQVNPTNRANWNEVADNAAANYSYRLGGYKVQAYLSVADNAYIVPTGVTQSLALDAGGRLTITGDQLANKNDAVALSLTAAGGVQVALNGETTRFDPGTVSSVVVAGASGANTLTLDFANGDPTLGGKLTYTGITALAVAGTAAGNNTFAVSGTGGGAVSFSVNGQSFTVAAGVTSVSVNGRGNNNTLTVDYAGGTIPAAVNYDGGGGTNNSLTLQGGSFAAGTYDPTGGRSGTVRLTGGATGTAGTVTYSNLSAVTDTTTAAAYTINGTAGNDTIGIVDGPAAGQTQVNSGGTFGPVNFANKTAVTVAALGGADTITLNNPHPATGLTGLTIDGGAGGNTVTVAGTAVPTTVTSTSSAAPFPHDVVTVGTAATGVRSVLAPLTVANPANLTDLTIDDTADGVGRTIAVTSTSVTGLAPAPIGYDPAGIGALTVLTGNGGNTFAVTGTAPGSANTFTGGAGADTFAVTGSGLGAGSTVTLNGGAGPGPAGDSFTVSPSAAATIVVTGNGPADTLNVNLAGTTNPFLISAGGVGSYTFGGGLKPITFTRIQTLQVPTNYLTVTVTDGRTTALPGTPVTYAVTVTNNSPLGLAGVAVSDAPPAALIPATVSAAVTATGPHSSASIGPAGTGTAAIAAGESITFTVTGTIDPSATGTIVNTATATTPAGLTDTVPADNTATDVDTLTPTADVSVTNTDGVTSASPGTTVTYTVVVTNTGPSTAAGVSVADAVPAGVTAFTWTSASSAGAAGSAGAGSGSIGETLTLPPAAAVTYTITAAIGPAAAGTLTNTATAAVAAGTTDPVPGNNTATHTDTLIGADLVVGVSGPPTAQTGTAFTYTITVTNSGPSPAGGVTLTHALPAGAAVDSIVPTAGLSVGRSGSTLTGTIASLAAGASVAVAVTVRPTAAGTATLTAAATGTTYDPNPANNTATAAVTVAAGPPLVGVPQFAVGADAGGSPVVTVYNPDGTVASTLTPFPGFTGGVRTAMGDFNGDGIPDVAVGTGPGMPAEVKVLDGKTGAVLFDRRPFGTFTGGVFVAAGDITGTGRADLVVTPDEGGGPRVEIVEGGDFREIADFFGINDPNFRGGARVALGDLNGDGKADLIVSAGVGGGPRVSVYDGAALLQGQFVHLIPDFFAFEPALRNGVYVAVGDVNGDGVDDVVLGAGPGGGPRVLVLSGRTLLAQGFGAAIGTPIANFFGGNTGNRGGIRVAVKSLDGDQYADVVTGSGTAGGSQVSAYLGKDLAAGSGRESRSFDAFAGFIGGVFVG